MVNLNDLRLISFIGDSLFLLLTISAQIKGSLLYRSNCQSSLLSIHRKHPFRKNLSIPDLLLKTVFTECLNLPSKV